MEITYAVRPADLWAFNEYHFAHSPSAKRTASRAKWGFALVIFFVIFTWISLIQKHPDLIPKLVFSGLGSLVFLGLHPWSMKRALRKHVRRAYAEGTNMGLYGEHTIRITESSLEEASATHQSRISLASIERVAATPSHTFIHTGAIQAYVVPHDTVSSGDLAQFLRHLQMVAPNLPWT